jgi:hypothetical protein
MSDGAFVGLLRASRLGWVTLDDALASASEERAWVLILR